MNPLSVRLSGRRTAFLKLREPLQEPPGFSHGEEVSQAIPFFLAYIREDKNFQGWNSGQANLSVYITSSASSPKNMRSARRLSPAWQTRALFPSRLLNALDVLDLAAFQDHRMLQTHIIKAAAIAYGGKRADEAVFHHAVPADNGRSPDHAVFYHRAGADFHPAA
ncbi:hypothetical protein MTKAM_02030 [Moorella thermoacetica]